MATDRHEGDPRGLPLRILPFLLLILLPAGCATVPEPAYRTVVVAKGYEVRAYEGYAVAETAVEGPWKEALNAGFRVLFDYIAGNNEGRAKVEMTAPVLAAPPEKVAMTAPVLAEARGGDGGLVVSFVAPAGYTAATMPRPKDPRVRLRDVAPHRAAALRYGGWTDGSEVREKADELAALLARDGLRALPPFRSAQYNPPWTPPPFRRNEILVELAPP